MWWEEPSFTEPLWAFLDEDEDAFSLRDLCLDLGGASIIFILLELAWAFEAGTSIVMAFLGSATETGLGQGIVGSLDNEEPGLYFSFSTFEKALLPPNIQVWGTATDDPSYTFWGATEETGRPGLPSPASRNACKGGVLLSFLINVYPNLGNVTLLLCRWIPIGWYATGYQRAFVAQQLTTTSATRAEKQKRTGSILRD